MKPHTAEQVTGLRSFAESRAGEVQTFKFHGLEVHYRVGQLPDVGIPYPVAAAVTGAHKDDYEIVVSDTVPAELSGIWAWHELFDFAVLGHGYGGRCATTEGETLHYLARCPAEERTSYLEHRIAFYEGLGAYMTRDIDENGENSQYDQGDVEGVANALRLLRAS